MQLRTLTLKQRRHLGKPFYKRGVRYARHVRVVHVKAHTRKYPTKKYIRAPLKSQRYRRRRRGGITAWTTGLEV